MHAMFQNLYNIRVFQISRESKTYIQYQKNVPCFQHDCLAFKSTKKIVVCIFFFSFSSSFWQCNFYTKYMILNI